MFGPLGAGMSIRAHHPAIIPPAKPLAAATETTRIHSPIALSGSRIALGTTPMTLHPIGACLCVFPRRSLFR
jgi:hypothetical protein